MMMMSKDTRTKYWIKLNGVPKNFLNLSFGRQVEYLRIVKEFKETANSVHISIKRRTAAAALKEFKELYQPTEYYARFYDSNDCRDDSVEVFYKT